jgi:hypothetical protein
MMFSICLCGASTLYIIHARTNVLVFENFKRTKKMKKLIITAAVAGVMATSVAAADMAAEIGVDVTKTNGEYAATPSIELSFGTKSDAATAFGGIEVLSEDGVVDISKWFVGMNFGAASVSFGDQGDLFDFGGLAALGGDTLADPEFDKESLIIRHGTLSGLVGFTDIGNDVSDIDTVQLGYSTALDTVNLRGAVSYDVNVENFILAIEANTDVTQTVNLGATVTYDEGDSLFAYETVATYGYTDTIDIAAFVNGDGNDAAQNIGAGLAYSKDSLSAYAEVSYNLDSEELTPAIGMTLKF